MRRRACSGHRLAVFTDIDAAIEEAEFIANQEREHGQYRAAYLVQYGHTIRVHSRKPKHMPVMMTVRPKSRLRMAG